MLQSWPDGKGQLIKPNPGLVVDVYFMFHAFCIFRTNSTVLGCAGFHGDCLTLTKLITARLQVWCLLAASWTRDKKLLHLSYQKTISSDLHHTIFSLQRTVKYWIVYELIYIVCFFRCMNMNMGVKWGVDILMSISAFACTSSCEVINPYQ